MKKNTAKATEKSMEKIAEKTSANFPIIVIALAHKPLIVL